MESSQPSGGISSPVNPMQPVVEFLKGGDPEAICARYGISREELDKRVAAYQGSIKQAAQADDLIVRKTGRNEPCPCGSGKKYKKCCLPRHEEARKNVPAHYLQQMEERSRASETLEKEVRKGFDFLFSQDFVKADRLAKRLLETFPEDDRLHDIAVSAMLAMGDYQNAFFTCRRRWQVSKEEKEFYQENGFHKREGVDRKNVVHFYSPSTWLDKFWISKQARAYSEMYPVLKGSPIAKEVEKLKAANDLKRFSDKDADGYEVRRQALEPVLSGIEAEGPAAIPYLLPLTYSFSWASLFVPDLLRAYGTDESVRLLAELSMFRLPFFAQKCLVSLESFGGRAVGVIDEILQKDAAFDDLKVGLISVLGNIETPESFAILTRLTDHESPYIVNWTAQALGKLKNPEALPYLEKAKERLGALSKIAGAIKDIAASSGK